MRPPTDPRTGQPLRECIGVYGPPAVGKSTNWKQIAQAYHLTSTPGSFYIINTDGYAADKLLSSSPELTNCITYNAPDWPAFRDASKEVSKQAQRGDWIIIDFADRPWKYVQNYFSRTVFGGGDDEFDEAEYLLQLRAEWQEKESGKQRDKRSRKDPQRSLSEGWDWGYINQLYDRRVLPLVLESPAHLYLTTEAAELNKDLEQDKVKRLIFGDVGYKMGGQKSLPYQIDTVILQTFTAGKRTMTNSVKDREREIFSGVEVNNFALNYLVAYAQWQWSEDG